VECERDPLSLCKKKKKKEDIEEEVVKGRENIQDSEEFEEGYNSDDKFHIVIFYKMKNNIFF
jgi:hypothetical protein